MPENTGPGQCRIEIPYHSGIGYCAHGMIPDGKTRKLSENSPFPQYTAMYRHPQSHIVQGYCFLTAPSIPPASGTAPASHRNSS